MTDATFKRIEPESDETLGPQTVLLCGHGPEAVEPIRGLLDGVEAGGHRLVLATQGMLARTLQEALEAEPADEPPLPAEKLPPVMILSGLKGAQIHGVLAGHRDTGLARPIFATATPVNLRFPLRELLVELLQEHRAMAERSKQGS